MKKFKLFTYLALAMALSTQAIFASAPAIIIEAPRRAEAAVISQVYETAATVAFDFIQTDHRFNAASFKRSLAARKGLAAIAGRFSETGGLVEPGIIINRFEEFMRVVFANDRDIYINKSYIVTLLESFSRNIQAVLQREIPAGADFSIADRIRLADALDHMLDYVVNNVIGQGFTAHSNFVLQADDRAAWQTKIEQIKGRLHTLLVLDPAIEADEAAAELPEQKADNAEAVIFDLAAADLATEVNTKLAHVFDGMEMQYLDLHADNPTFGRKGTLALWTGKLNQYGKVAEEGFFGMRFADAIAALNTLNRADQDIRVMRDGIAALLNAFVAHVQTAIQDPARGGNLSAVQKENLYVHLKTLLDNVVENLVVDILCMNLEFYKNSGSAADRVAFYNDIRALVAAHKQSLKGWLAITKGEDAITFKADLTAAAVEEEGDEVVIHADTTGFSAATAPHRAITVDAAAYAKADKIISETLAEKPSYSVATRIAAALGGATATAAAAWALQAMIAYATTGSPVA